VFSESAGGADLVEAHEARIACDIRRQYRRQSSLDTLARHEAPRSAWAFAHVSNHGVWLPARPDAGEADPI
jgi:hypothetical protein